MKKSHSLVLATLATLALSTTPALAGTEPGCPNCSAKHVEAKPYPVKVVSPTNLPRNFVRSTVEVALTLDEKGVPTDVHTLGYVDRQAAKQIIAAVSQWRFSPKMVDGKAVAGHFVMPVEVTPSA